MATDPALSGYICPTCLGPLAFQPEAGAPASGGLTCAAGHGFPVEQGLPRFVDDEGYAGSFGYQWRRHDRVQVDSASGASISRDRFFRGTGWPESMPGERILEAGSGSGRFTEVLLATGAEIYAFDYSRAADVTQRTFGPRGAHVCQASIYAMPYPEGFFDRVFCYGVIQHTPDVRASFLALTKMVKPGGHLAVDVYDRRRMWFNARYRVRWFTTRMNKETLHRWCETVVPLWMTLFPPMHPWNQLLVPLKDYRGVLQGLSREQEIAWSILDTFDMLSPVHDHPQTVATMRRWAEEAGLEAIEVFRGGNGIELRARRPRRPQ